MKEKTADAKAKKSPRFAWKYFVYDFVWIGGALPGLIWFRPKIIREGSRSREALRGGALLVSNHIGFFDPIYLMFGVPTRRHHFICSKELSEHRIGPWLRRCLCIPIDRENFTADSFREITSHLSAGELVTMFPEGRINTDGGEGGVAAFKSGMILMALRARTPIIPVYLRPKTHWWQRLVVVIGEPFDVAERYGARPTFSQIDAAAEELHRKEEELSTLIESSEK